MTAGSTAGAQRAILIDVGGVLIRDYWPAAVGEWARGLGTSPSLFMDALFGGSDDQILIGRVSEAAWWQIVAGRLQVAPELLSELRADLEARESWDIALLACLADARRHASIVIISNAWPHMRARMSRAGLLDVADHAVLSCEIGQAKPDVRIYRAALQRAGVSACNVLFVDDTPGHVAAAQALGMTGHVHVDTPGTITQIRHFAGSPA